MTTRILDVALNAMWAMEESALVNLLMIAARQHDVSDEALEAYRAKALAGAERATMRDGVAIIPVDGPLFPKANLMTQMSGATSYAMLMSDLTQAKDAGAKGIILNINSPGGAVTNVSELSQAIYDMRGAIPIVAYVNGMAASAALMIASAADKVVLNDMAQMGSLGVMSTYPGADPKDKSITFISSQSPLKNADPGTDTGAKEIQARVDAMAQVFVETVARNRGVDTETALSEFGKGGMFVGEGAVKAGLADAVGSFEGVLAELASGQKPKPPKPSQKPGAVSTKMSEEVKEPVDTAPAAPAITVADVAAAATTAATEAMTAERKRIGMIQKFGTAHGAESSVIQKAIDDGTDALAFSEALADASLAKSKETKDKALAGLVKDEAVAGAPGASDAPVDGLTDTQAGEKLALEIVASAQAASGIKK